MKQPDLGKKISELRLAKGLTQGELAEKCNVSLRTIQRIESAEVTPRSYTVKLIFTHLEYEIFNSFGKLSYRLDRTAYGFNIRLERLYHQIIDLFNLKTNTMRKISILSIIITAIVLGVFAVNTNLNAQNTNKHKRNKNAVEKLAEPELHFFDFSCYGCMEKKGIVIGRDISFRLNGVEVRNIRLMTLDKETREFDALFVEGKLQERRVLIDYAKESLIESGLKYSADDINTTDDQIILKGHAMVYPSHADDNPENREYIASDEIIISLR